MTNTILFILIVLIVLTVLTVIITLFEADAYLSRRLGNGSVPSRRTRKAAPTPSLKEQAKAILKARGLEGKEDENGCLKFVIDKLHYTFWTVEDAECFQVAVIFDNDAKPDQMVRLQQAAIRICMENPLIKMIPFDNQMIFVAEGCVEAGGTIEYLFDKFTKALPQVIKKAKQLCCELEEQASQQMPVNGEQTADAETLKMLAARPSIGFTAARYVTLDKKVAV